MCVCGGDVLRGMSQMEVELQSAESLVAEETERLTLAYVPVIRCGPGHAAGMPLLAQGSTAVLVNRTRCTGLVVRCTGQLHAVYWCSGALY